MSDDLFSFGERMQRARAARDEGMSRVEAGASIGWTDLMYELVVEVAKARPRFTSDDVFDLAELRGTSTTHDLRAFGPVMMRAARDGVCQKADCAAIPSRRASLHASPRAVWESLICRHHPVFAHGKDRSTSAGY